MQKSTSLAWLIVNEGTPDEFQVEITENKTTLGRESACDIQVNDPLSSRLHAVIYFRDDGYAIEDQKSSNGTFVNEKEVRIGPVVDGDLIRIGNTTLLMKTGPDPDATIIQKRDLDETVVALHPTVPHGLGAVPCQICGQPNPKDSMFCSKCGKTLPQLSPSFQKAQEDFENLQITYQSGKLNEGDFHAALAELVVQDDEGDFWMLGVESGEWYWFDGDEWHLRLPPLHLPVEGESQSPVSPSVQDPEQVEPPLPSRSSRSRWGAIGLWLVGVLIVLVFGIYVVIELIDYSRTGPASQTDPNSFNVAEEPLEDAGEVIFPDSTTTVDTLVQDSQNDIQARPFDPSGDGGLLSLTADTEYLADQSTNDYEKYTSNFFDSAGILIMGWCAIDQDTLDNNLSLIDLIGTFDGVTIPSELWSEETSQKEDMVCQIYRTVVEELEPGIHRFFWSTKYDVSINDGWETYQPGTYINEFTINIAENSDRGYLYQDDFESDGGHWGELDLDEVKSRIEGGALHIELYQPSLNAINHFQDRDFDDFTITGYARNLSENPGMYGIIFRTQDDQNYYYFQVTDQGYFRFGKKINESIDIIPWTTSDLISRQGESNKLTVTMEGDRILAFINDQQVVDLQDSTYQFGGLGLIAGSPAEYNGYHAAFEQVSIEATE